MSWRARPVFISGTFRDMHEERDLLATRVFHALEEELGKHYTTLERVDLRVGVETRDLADDHLKQELVLKVCLEDVARCRPFLIVLIGDRYGWVPPIERARAAAREAGFQTELEGKSVTALEIEYGLWGNPDQQTLSRIYFRQLDYTGMDEAHAIVYSDERAAASPSVSGDERAKATARAAALKASKERLRSDPVLGPRCRNYPAQWDPSAKKVTSLTAFIDAVVSDLLPDMVAEAKEQVAAAQAGTLPTPLEQFVAERARGFRGRSDTVSQLVAHATSTTDTDAPRGRIVAGASGAGKSAIFARVHEDLSAAQGEDFWLLAHAAGIDPRSTSVVNLLEDWVALLAGRLGIDNPLAVPADGSEDGMRLPALSDSRPKPQEAFADLLSRAAARKRVVLLLDALDRFERTPQAEHVTWLPQRLPANARLIATAVTGPETEALARRPDVVVEPLEALTREEADAIAKSVYDRYHRQPNQDAVRALVDKPGQGSGSDDAPARGNALWLVSALEELNLLDGDDFRRAESGTEGTDEDRLHAMVVAEAGALPGDVEGLYTRIFERAGRRVSDDPGQGAALTRAFASAIALSRNGFRELDLAALVPGVARLLDPASPKLTWDALAFASLRRALRAHLVRRGEDDRWDFHHRQARAAAERAYVPNAGVRERIHQLMADHLLDLAPADPLRESEATHHLIQADASEQAARLYAGELTPGGLAGCQETLARHALDEEGLTWVTGLLEVDALERDVLVALGERYLHDLDAVFDRMYVLTPRAGVARGTEQLFRKLFEKQPNSHGIVRDLSVSLDNVGRVELACGNLDSAAAAYAEMLTLARGLADPASPESLRVVTVSLDNVGKVELARGNLDAAAVVFAESLAFRRGVADPTRPESLRDVSVSLNKVGQVELVRGNLDAAAVVFAESLTLARGLADPARLESLRDVSVSLDFVGQVALARGNLDGAAATYAESLTLRRGLTDPGRPESLRNLSVSLDNIGRVELARGNLDDAAAAYAEMLSLARKLADPVRFESLRDVSVSLNNVGQVKLARGDLDGAAAVFAESLALRRLSDPTRPESMRDLFVSLANVGRVELARGNLEGAAAAYAESLTLGRSLSNPARPESLRDVSVSLDNVGRVELARGNLDGAAAAYAESLTLGRSLSNPARPESLRDVSVSLDNVGQVELACGNLDGAAAAYAESLTLARSLADPARPESLRDVSVSLDNVGQVQLARGNLDGAAAAYAESLTLGRSLSNPARPESLRDVSVSLNNVGQVELARGNLDGAAAMFGASLAIRERLVAADPGNALWQRDLAVSNYHLASLLQQSQDPTAADYRRRCLDVLHRIRASGMFLDPPLEGLLEQLDREFS